MNTLRGLVDGRRDKCPSDYILNFYVMQIVNRIGNAADQGADFLQSLTKALRMLSSDNGVEVVNELKNVIRMVDDSLFCLEDVIGESPELEVCVREGDSYVRELARLRKEVHISPDATEQRMLEEALQSACEAVEFLRLLVPACRSRHSVYLSER